MKQYKQTSLSDYSSFKPLILDLEKNSKSFHAYLEALKASNKACFSQTSLKTWLKTKKELNK